MNHVKRPDDERAGDGRQSPRRIEVQPGTTPADTSRRLGQNAARPAGPARPVEAARPIEVARPMGRMPPPRPAPSPAPAGAPPEVAHTPKEGWDLEQPQTLVPQQKSFLSQGGLRKILIAAGGLLLALIALRVMFGPTRDGGVLLTRDDQKLLSDYRRYVGQSNPPPAYADQKVSEVEQRLKAYRWADSLSDKERADREYLRLLLFDADRGSPLYKYCIQKLRRK